MSILDAIAAVRAGGDVVASGAAACERLAGAQVLNASTWHDAGLVESQCIEVAKLAAQGRNLGPLAGVPVAVKANLAVSGQVHDAASAALSGHIAPAHARSVQAWSNASAIVLCGANMDEMGMGSTGETSVHGPTQNPAAPGHIPGGSSSGCAALVAAGVVPLALGSDTGGSVRQPASHCGVVGVKPTPGRIPRTGLIPFANSLDTVGVLASTVQGAALGLHAACGHDPQDASSLQQPAPTWAVDLPLRGRRVGILASAMELADDAVQQRVMEAASALEAAGVQVTHVHLPHFEHALACYQVLSAAEASSNMARYMGLTTGPMLTGEQFVDALPGYRSSVLGAEVQRRVLLGVHALASGHRDQWVGHAQRVRATLRAHTLGLLHELDLLLLPTVTAPAPALGATADPVALAAQDRLTVLANLAGVPAVSVPAGTVSGLPVGAQLLGRPLDEPVVLSAAAAIEAAQR